MYAKMAESEEVHNIVIVGGSFGGITIAHKLLKSSLPAVSKESGGVYKVTMVSQSTHFWWSVGAPRAMFTPYPNDTMDSFLPIEPAFRNYPAGAFKFVHGEATDLDAGARRLTIKDPKTGELHRHSYNTLIIATGAMSSSPLFSLHGGHEATLEAYKDMQARAPHARTLMVVGGGSAGVETAGELGSLYGNTKEITLISTTVSLLPALRPAIGETAKNYLESMGVKIMNTTKMISSTTTEAGVTEVVLDNGETRIVDVLIVATGRKANTRWLPSRMLDERGAVRVNRYLRVIDAGERVYAIGDVASCSRGGLLDFRDMVPVLMGSIETDLGMQTKAIKPFVRNDAETMIVPVGPNKGVGALFGWRIPSWAVWLIKSRNFFFSNAVGYLQGTEL